MFAAIKKWGESLAAKIGVITNEVKTYIEVGVGLLTNLENALANPLAQLVIKDLVPSQDEALVSRIENVIPEALKYLTQSDTVLAATTPDEMLQLFLKDIENDTAGMKQTKLLALIAAIVKELDGNSLLPAIYTWLVSKYAAHQTVGA